LPTPFLGFGHRVSIGVVLHGADNAATAAGLAEDILRYDQQGCLSAAMLFTEGECAPFAEHLAAALEHLCRAWRVPPRTLHEAAAVRAVRAAAAFAPGARLWGDPQQRWTLVHIPGRQPEPSCGLGVVRLHALRSISDLEAQLAPLRRHLQGAALAAPPERRREAAEMLARAGVNRICAPGRLQAPPFSWHHDGRPVLASLVRWVDVEDE
ncbi:MAG: acyl-CoA reductase, partial [Armatimonadota bacterium]|nr:acyl-CoA reductase [Armatimonadota bacterium]